METAIQKNSSLNWTEDQIQLIHDTVAKGTTLDEFKLFLYTASKYGFDPLVKKIWCVKYGTAPATIFTGRDGFLQKAHESGQFDGMKTTPNFDANGKLISATCLVYRKDMKYPFEVTVYNREYNSGKSNWLKMEITMLSKVAESQALRKAFDISGIYAAEEGDIINKTVEVVAQEEPKKEFTEANFEAAAKAKATIELIKANRIVSEETEKKYLEFLATYGK